MLAVRRFASLAAAVAFTAAAGGAAAQTQQPDGVPIPQGSGLQDLFTSRGEAINALNDALTVPETFIPSCALTFEVLQRNAGYQNSFGWYNVTGSKPSDAELHEFLSCTDGVGTVKILQIKQDPGYAGGEIGFYEATGACATTQSYDYLFFSEKKYNPDGSQANPYIHLLTYNSTVVPKAFYFGWEDLLSGGDNDFDDLTTFVTGISCSGGGGECRTGQPGVCGAGTLQCQNGMLACVQTSQPTAEKCDGVDNDCNDLVDDGDLCDPGEVCDKGTCVPACGGGEFVCPEGTVCNDGGYCVDPDCLTVTCPGGTKCVDGLCVGPCDGVVCPYGQVCVVGVCLDPCVGIACDEGQVCVGGACVDTCACAGCPGGSSCQPDGKCLFDACVGETCPAGEYCDAAGACVDACAGAACPAGEVCVAGQCVTGSDAGAGGGGQGGSIFVGAGGGDVTATGASTGAGDGGAGGGGATLIPGQQAGCGCALPGGREGGAWATLLGLTSLLGLSRRRARRRPADRLHR